MASTHYVSPLKALSVDIHRNLSAPVSEMGLNISLDTRTGDTLSRRGNASARKPPNILLTTPESLSLLLSYEDSDIFFGTLQSIIIDELCDCAKQAGELLALGLARLQSLAPSLRRVGLSATVRDPKELQTWLSPTAGRNCDDVDLVQGRSGEPKIVQHPPKHGDMPWAGHMGLYAAKDILRQLRDHKMSIVFVNTRAQAELLFNELWKINDCGLPIGMHHGSLEPEQRKGVEQAMATGQLRAVVATASLDLGIDWGDVDRDPGRRTQRCQQVGSAYWPCKPSTGQPIKSCFGAGEPV